MNGVQSKPGVDNDFVRNKTLQRSKCCDYMKVRKKTMCPIEVSTTVYVFRVLVRNKNRVFQSLLGYSINSDI